MAGRLAGLGLAALLTAGTVGCAMTNEEKGEIQARMLGFGLGAAAVGNPSSSAVPGLLFASEAAKREADAKERERLAREGRSQVNITINSPGNPGGSSSPAPAQKYNNNAQIINLDTGEIVEAYDHKECFKRAYATHTFPKKGFKILYPPRDDGKREWLIVEDTGIDENYRIKEQGCN